MPSGEMVSAAPHSLDSSQASSAPHPHVWSHVAPITEGSSPELGQPAHAGLYQSINAPVNDGSHPLAIGPEVNFGGSYLGDSARHYVHKLQQFTRTLPVLSNKTLPIVKQALPSREVRER